MAPIAALKRLLNFKRALFFSKILALFFQAEERSLHFYKVNYYVVR